MTKSPHERKTELEIEKLRNETSLWGTFSVNIWPIVAFFITFGSSAVALWISVHTQGAQFRFQKEQETFSEKQKQRESLAKAIELATDPQGKTDRKVAGVWQLNEFWGTDEDQKLIASVLAAELTLPDDYRLVRCAAAEVIGNAESAVAKKENPDKERQMLVRILYGNKDGEIGLVVHQHLLLRSTYFGPTDAGGYSNTPDPKASNDCATALDATREAIRLNWAFLHEVNLNGTDLSQIQLYEADLAGASLRSAYLNHANFQCANLSHADLEGAHWDTADFNFTNVTGSKPDKFREYARAHGALPDMADSDWLKWRDNSFRIGKKRNVQLESQDGMECGTGHPAEKK